MAFELLPVLSAVFGWIYTFCWSASFYPQPLLNFRRRSTSGTTVDFPFINCLGKYSHPGCLLWWTLAHADLLLLGFFAYLVSNACFYYSPLIRAQYAQRNHGLTPTVQFNDITFAAHALLVSCITTSQYWAALWSFTPSSGNRPSASSQS
jgi:cystinosin